jgi:hypothetical protein
MPEWMSDKDFRELGEELHRLNAICGGEWYLQGKGYGEFANLTSAQGYRDAIEESYVYWAGKREGR